MLRVTAPCRLHLGQLDLNGSLGRMYGGIGVALDGPRIVLRAERQDGLVVEGFDTARVSDLARTFMNKAQIGSGARIVVRESIPAHIGLGSGSLLSLSVGSALSTLYDLGLTIEDVARMMLPSDKCDVCVGIFKSGGLVVASGVPRELDWPGAEGYVPPTIFQRPFPQNWRFIVVTPETATQLGQTRHGIPIDMTPPIPPEDVGLVCRLLVMQLLPAVIEGNIDEFGQALTEMQWTIGKQFAQFQGGLYSHPSAEGIVRLLLDNGATGAGQSSWGPTVYAVVEGDDAAQRLETTVGAYLAEANIAAHVRCLRVRNSGARVAWEDGGRA